MEQRCSRTKIHKRTYSVNLLCFLVLTLVVLTAGGLSFGGARFLLLETLAFAVVFDLALAAVALAAEVLDFGLAAVAGALAATGLAAADLLLLLLLDPADLPADLLLDPPALTLLDLFGFGLVESTVSTDVSLPLLKALPLALAAAVVLLLRG